MRGIALGVAIVALGLFLIGLGRAPYTDPPEGFHTAVAKNVAVAGDPITLRINGVRYFDKPPLPYWLMAVSFRLFGVTPFAARLVPAVSAVGVAAVTAQLGTILGGPRVGLLAGLMVSTNLGIFVYARILKPDLLLILFLMLAFAGFIAAYRGAGRWGLGMFWAALGFAALAKDILGVFAPLLVIGVFFWLTRERPIAPWIPWWGPLLTAAIALPWYLLVEWRNPGYLAYNLFETHLLNFTRQRAFQDEDVPLGALEFLLVTGAAFLPWIAAAPWAVMRALRRPWPDATARLWALLALWVVVVIGFFTLSPFKLPHYGLPAFPMLALLVAKVWDESIDAAPHSVRPRTLIVPVLVVFTAAAVAAALAWSGRLPIPDEIMASVDVATRNRAARGLMVVEPTVDRWAVILATCAIVFGLGAVAAAVAVWRRSPALGVGVALATMAAFLPAAADGMATFARMRSPAPLIEALVQRLGPHDIVAHEGPLETTASLVLRMDRPVRIVDGLQSNLAFGSTFPEARELFWDAPRLAQAWQEPRRIFLVTGRDPVRSVVRSLPPELVHLLAGAGGRWLYSNAPTP